MKAIFVQRHNEIDTGYHRVTAHVMDTESGSTDTPVLDSGNIYKDEVENVIENLRHIYTQKGYAFSIVEMAEPKMSSYEDRPHVVCLCGSTKFKSSYEKAVLEESLKGSIVLSVICYNHADNINLTEEQKILADKLHKRKIEMAHEILVLNVGGYIGKSTQNEIEHARRLGKKIRYLVEL